MNRGNDKKKRKRAPQTTLLEEIEADSRVGIKNKKRPQKLKGEESDDEPEVCTIGLSMYLIRY